MKKKGNKKMSRLKSLITLSLHLCLFYAAVLMFVGTGFAILG